MEEVEPKVVALRAGLERIRGCWDAVVDMATQLTYRDCELEGMEAFYDCHFQYLYDFHPEVGLLVQVETVIARLTKSQPGADKEERIVAVGDSG